MGAKDVIALVLVSPFILAAFVVEAILALLEWRRPRWPWMLFCTCPEDGGPAGDYHHHRRDCFAARHFGQAEDPQTGWVYVGP
jgi:hypothetical protein